ETRRNLCVEQPNPVPMQERKEILRLLIGDKEFDFHGKGAGKLEEVTFVQDVMPSEAGHGLEGRATPNTPLIGLLQKPFPHRPSVMTMVFMDVESKQRPMHGDSFGQLLR